MIKKIPNNVNAKSSEALCGVSQLAYKFWYRYDHNEISLSSSSVILVRIKILASKPEATNTKIAFIP